MERVSPNFTLQELTFSQEALRKGIDNTPPPSVLEYLGHLCNELLEPARALLGVPLHVDSGYRCSEVNIMVGGAALSAHQFGRAADVIPIGMELQEAFDRLRASALAFDQIIFECRAWLHLAIAPTGAFPRRQALLAAGTPGRWTYQLATQ
jgi:hypothetical protein